MTAFISWWLAIQLFGLATLPLTRRVMGWLPDLGYAFSKIGGLLLVSYLLWLGAVTGVLVNDIGGITFALLAVAGVSAWTWLARGWKPALAGLGQFWRENRAQVLTTEILFLLTFAGWTLVRVYAPDKIIPAGGEKYMEIAFLNGVLNSPRFPPLDPWLAGFGISYYYFGYVMMAVMTRLTGVAPVVGFDLYDALLFALTAAGAYGVVSNLVAAGGGSSRAARLTGLLGTMFVGGLGNLQGLLEGLYSSRALPGAFWQWLDIPDLAGNAQSGSFYPGHGWWWWRASRVVRDLDLFSRPVVFQPIDEFPFFSFLLGDNHPHKLALPFVLLCIALALNLLLKKAAGPALPAAVDQPSAAGGGWLARAWQHRSEAGQYAFYALSLGGLGFLNTWDMPIYVALVLLAYTAGKMRSGVRADLQLLLRTLALGAGLGLGAILLYLFFYLGFASQAGGILPYVFQPTRLAHYLVMFGPFIPILVIFLALAARKAGGRRFPWAAAGRAWLWIAGLSLGAYLLVVFIAAGVLSVGGLQTLPIVQAWLGGETPLQMVGRILTARVTQPWLFLLLSGLLALAIAAILRGGKPEAVPAGEDAHHPQLSPATLFALLLALAGLGLTLAVEFFYLRDNFGMRMNTVFKFYFQGWVLMACASAFAAWWVARHTRPAARALFLAGTAALVAAGLVYPAMSIISRTEGFSRRPILSAAASVAGEYPGHWAALPDDWQAIQWLIENVRVENSQAPVILEAPGGGYESSGRVSAFTGLPTLLGWINHEGQWRGSQEEINRRLPDIETIYTTSNPEQALELLRKWNVRYVVLGRSEQQFIEKTCRQTGKSCNPAQATARFDRVLIPVFSFQSITLYAVPR